MTEPTPLDRVEKASSVVRNVVIVLGAIGSVFVLLYEYLDRPVTAQLDVFVVEKDRFLVTNSDTFPTVLRSALSGEVGQPALKVLNSELGRLDGLASLTVRNAGKEPVHLQIRVRVLEEADSNPLHIERANF